MASHLVFLLYLLALVLGVAVSVRLYPYRASYRGLKQALIVNWLIAAFTAHGAGALYLAVNLKPTFDVLSVFLTGAGLILSCLIMALPWQLETTFCVKHSKQTWFNGLALICTLTVIVIPIIGNGHPVWVLMLPVLSILTTLIYSHRVHRKHSALVSTPKHIKRLGVVLPPCYVAFALLEGLVYGDYVIELGTTVSLPLIYILASAALGQYATQIFPKNTTVLADQKGLVRPEGLTDKEFDVALAVHQGLSNKLIADQLNIAPSTVKNHLYTIYKKLSVKNRVALIKKLSDTHS